ncbi:hypothetical protein GCM10027162_44480 [Streptomyces incanus]
MLSALGVPGDVDHVGSALAERSAQEAEEAVYAAGGLAVALRTPEEWAAHKQSTALVARPLVERERERLDEAHTRVFAPIESSPLLPAAGLRVLDLTRVLAGPVATRTLALLGADVLRLDRPDRPEEAVLHADTGFGKRSARLDLAFDRAAFEELLADADVVVTGYRPVAEGESGLWPAAFQDAQLMAQHQDLDVFRRGGAGRQPQPT